MQLLGYGDDDRKIEIENASRQASTILARIKTVDLYSRTREIEGLIKSVYATMMIIRVNIDAKHNCNFFI